MVSIGKIFNVAADTLHRISLDPNANENKKGEKALLDLRIAFSSLSKFEIALDYDTKKGTIYCVGISEQDFSINFDLPLGRFDLNQKGIIKLKGKGRLPQIFMEKQEAFKPLTIFGFDDIKKEFPKSELKKRKYTHYDTVNSINKTYHAYVYTFDVKGKHVRVDTMHNLPFWMEFDLP